VTSETVFRVNAAGKFLGGIEPMSLESAAHTERGHLQEWVLEHAEIIGSDVMIITSEFDGWRDSLGAQVADRLDVLGLDRDGRLVVAELKRGRAPRLTDLQAINYAAMVSRFTVEDLIDAHARFLARRNEPAQRDEVAQLLANFVRGGELSEARFDEPRIVILAEDFSPALLSSVEWLSPDRIDISLRQIKLYRTAPDATDLLATVSQVWPLPEVEDFRVRPRGRDHGTSDSDTTLPAVPWSAEDLQTLRDRLRGTKQEDAVLLLLDKASESPELTVSWEQLLADSHRNQYQLRSDLAHLTMMVKSDFGRRNWPFGDSWRGGVRTYFLDAITAGAWQQLRLRDG
jgi:hypothetical protein